MRYGPRLVERRRFTDLSAEPVSTAFAIPLLNAATFANIGSLRLRFVGCVITIVGCRVCRF
jgi:hypothetical protein